jgi:DnaJ-domain-containing protein 1
MIDHFAALSEPRRPWLDLEKLKNRFHILAAARHPDTNAANDADPFASLNKSYSVLRDPAARLRHLLELEYPDALAASVQIPADLAEHFMQTAAQQRALRAVAGPRDESAPALMKAVREQKRTATQAEAKATLATLEKEYERAIVEVQELDALWSLAAAPVVVRLAQLQIRLAYLGHWIGDLREALLELSL